MNIAFWAMFLVSAILYIVAITIPTEYSTALQGTDLLPRGLLVRKILKKRPITKI